jgi:TonB-linked SusC/RagA family outer membrane protein
MLKNSLITVIMLFIQLALPASLVAQEKINLVLKGQVLDAQSNPLIGVTLALSDSRSGAVTDLDGTYTLNVSVLPGTYTLQASYVGYKSVTADIQISADKNLMTQNFTLFEDALDLDEIVVTGSTLKSSRRQLGNAISTVSADELSKTGSENLISSLQGKVPGAQITQTSGDPAGGLNIRIRGVNSIRGNSDPLYVIDGVIVSNTTNNVSQVSVSAGAADMGTNRLADINPKDIESINIISGAAAAAVYGSRASNGVVVITTKRGSVGKPEITFGTSVNVNQLRKKLAITTYGKQFGSVAQRLHIINPFSGGPTVATNGRNLPTALVDVTRYDYQDQVFGDAMGTDNYLSMSGGKDNTKYYASLSYMTNGGIVKNTDFTRYGLRLNLDQGIKDWMKISFGLQYNNSFSNEKPNGNSFYSPVNAINITNNIYDITKRDANGNLQAVEPTRVNPLSVIEDFDITQEVNRAISNLTFTFFPLKGLTIDYVLGADVYSQTGKTFIPSYPYPGVNVLYFANGYAANVTSNFRLFNNDINATYQKDITSSISSTTALGFNYQYSRADRLFSAGENLLPSISTINGSSAVVSNYGLDQYAISGYFLQQTFGVSNKLFLTLAGRVDGSTKFALDQRNQFYPKFGLSYVLSETNFWKNSPLKGINSFKLRSSWGESGGLNAIGSYDRFYQFSPVVNQGRQTFIPSSQLANANIRPERTRSFEVGADASFFENKVSLLATYYRNNVFDLVVNRLIAPTEGGRSIVDNVGELENRGVEIALGVNIAQKKDFNWDVNFIYSRNRGKVISAGSPLVAINTATGAPIFLVQGEAPSIFFGTFYAKNADGTLLLDARGLPQPEKGTALPFKTGSDIPAGSYVYAGTIYTPKRDASGQPTGTALRKIIGDPNPDFMASFGSSVRYKRLNFSFLLDGVFGVDVFNADRRTRQGVGIGDYAEQEMKGELVRGYVWAIYPIEEWRVDPGQFVKIREVSLSYNLPNPLKGISDLNVALIGRNLFSFDQYDGFDPETNAGGNSDLFRGVDFGNVPIPRTFQLSVTAKF